MRIGKRDVAITNLEKVFFPGRGLTKGDLVSYYVDIAPYALNHVERRPMQMKRYPHGVEGEFFYQKRVPQPHPDWLETVYIVFPGSGRTADFPVVTDTSRRPIRMGAERTAPPVIPSSEGRPTSGPADHESAGSLPHPRRWRCPSRICGLPRLGAGFVVSREPNARPA